MQTLSRSPTGFQTLMPWQPRAPGVEPLALLQTLIPRLSTLLQFRTALHNVAALPGALQVPPLEAMGGRILALPCAEQNRAALAFVQFETKASSLRLEALRRAARGGAGGLRQREAELLRAENFSFVGGPGGSRIEPVPEVARRCGVSSGPGIQALEQAALPYVEALLLRGHSAPHAAGRMGITTARGLAEVDLLAADTVGCSATQDRQQHPVAVAQRLGIQHPAALARLKLHAALGAVLRGGHPGQAIRDFGVASAEHQHSVLRCAVEACGLPAVAAGGTVQQVATCLGLAPMPELVSRLEVLVLTRIALPDIRQGAAPAAVAARLGIEHPRHIELLYVARRRHGPALARAAGRAC